MYCHNFHLVLSDADFSFVDHLCHVYRVISHMMNMCPNLISLFHRIFFYVDRDVGLYSAVSRWVTCFVVASPLWHVVIGSLVAYSFFFNFFIWFGKYFVQSVYYDETIHTWRLWWLPSSVVCDILFKDINSCSVIWSPSMNSAGRPHLKVFEHIVIKVFEHIVW